MPTREKPELENQQKEKNVKQQEEKPELEERTIEREKNYQQKIKTNLEET